MAAHVERDLAALKDGSIVYSVRQFQKSSIPVPYRKHREERYSHHRLKMQVETELNMQDRPMLP